MKKFCNRCGRLLDMDEVCSCNRTDDSRRKRGNNFYEKPAWRKLAKEIKIRDYLQDRLQLYFCRFEPTNDIETLIRDFVIDAYGIPRKFTGGLICHHVIPREDDATRQYDRNNLLSVNTHVHEFIHMLYNAGKKNDVQQLLFKCINAVLP